MDIMLGDQHDYLMVGFVFRRIWIMFYDGSGSMYMLYHILYILVYVDVLVVCYDDIGYPVIFDAMRCTCIMTYS